jgi:hypothetical protein
LEDTFAAIERVRAILAYVGKRMASADPLLISWPVIEEMASLITSSRTEIEAFLSNGNAGHLMNANSQAERAIQLSAQVPGVYSPEELQALIAATTEYRDLYQEKIRNEHNNVSRTIQEGGALDQRLTALESELQAERQKIVQIATEYQGQFSSAQDVRGKEFAEAQGQRQVQHGQLMAEFEKALVSEDAEFKSRGKEMFDESENIVADLKKQLRERAEDVLNDIDKRRKEVEALVGVIGNLGVTSGYLRAANSAKVAMWLWQTLTVGSLGLLTYLAYKTLPLLEESGGRFNWGAFAGRVLLLGSLGVIAAYAGSQADKLFSDEKRNRKLALELEAIGPFLASLPKEEQDKFKVQVGDRSFGRDLEAHLSGRQKSPVSLLDLASSKESKELFDLVIEYAKKLK